MKVKRSYNPCFSNFINGEIEDGKRRAYKIAAAVVPISGALGGIAGVNLGGSGPVVNSAAMGVMLLLLLRAPLSLSGKNNSPGHFYRIASQMAKQHNPSELGSIGRNFKRFRRHMRLFVAGAVVAAGSSGVTGYALINKHKPDLLKDMFSVRPSNTESVRDFWPQSQPETKKAKPQNEWLEIK